MSSGVRKIKGEGSEPLLAGGKIGSIVNQVAARAESDREDRSPPRRGSTRRDLYASL